VTFKEWFSARIIDQVNWLVSQLRKQIFLYYIIKGATLLYPKIILLTRPGCSV